jgi:hypothetical protein
VACLKAAVALDSEESAALNRGQRFGSGGAGPEPIAVNCTLVTAGRLLKVAQRSCPDVVPEIRVAMAQARQELTIALSRGVAGVECGTRAANSRRRVKTHRDRPSPSFGRAGQRERDFADPLAFRIHHAPRSHFARASPRCDPEWAASVSTSGPHAWWTRKRRGLRGVRRANHATHDRA